MTWKTTALMFAVLALGTGASQGAPAPATQPAITKTKPIGHTPRPVQDIGRSDLFHGYRCGATDCLLHQQGYQWGADHRITNPRDCHGTSEEFLEGCLAFAGVDGPLGHKEFDASFPHTWGID
jgi:hypothetical protein